MDLLRNGELKNFPLGKYIRREYRAIGFFSIERTQVQIRPKIYLVNSLRMYHPRTVEYPKVLGLYSYIHTCINYYTTKMTCGKNVLGEQLLIVILHIYPIKRKQHPPPSPPPPPPFA